jgi:hypothetical protein
MPAILIVKQGSTSPPVEATLENLDGPIDLTAAEKVRFIMRAGSLLIEGVCSYSERANGGVVYQWAAGDTDSVGPYRAEWEIHWPGGIPSVPNEGYAVVEIEERL